jgi:pSer/pThr/pTyr-binding forkhead associated (FHA) protein
MTDGRTPRTLLIPDRLWQAFEQMAGEMGNDRDGLINQALFLFAREQGYLSPGVSSQPPPDEASSAGADLAAADDEGGDAGVPTPPSARTNAITPAPPTKVLVLLSDGREIDRVLKDRFVIGRGKHCDLVVNSAKVSREHAAITREGDAYFIEDLGSSNGTWFDQQRIARRRIEEGDEYLISAERLICAFR